MAQLEFQTLTQNNLLVNFYTHIFRQIMKVLQTNLSHIIRSWELYNILYYALNSKKKNSLEVIWHIKCMQSSVCLPHVLLFPAMLICPSIISSHHILLTVLLSPPPPYTFTDLSLLLREFHLHWEIASVIEPVGYNLEKKLWQIINILNIFRATFKSCFYHFCSRHS